MVRIRIPNGIDDLSVNFAPSPISPAATPTESPTSPFARTFNCTGSPSNPLPEVLDGLWQVGLNTTGACGDVVRNVTGCPVAGVDADEIVDASPLVLEASQLLAGNAEFYNLPRKFKISITGCHSWCSYPGDQRHRPDRGHAPYRRQAAKLASRCAWPADFRPNRISALG